MYFARQVFYVHNMRSAKIFANANRCLHMR